MIKNHGKCNNEIKKMMGKIKFTYKWKHIQHKNKRKLNKMKEKIKLNTVKTKRNERSIF